MKKNDKLRKFIVTTVNGKNSLSLGGPHIGIGMEPEIKLDDISNFLDEKEMKNISNIDLGGTHIGTKDKDFFGK